MKKWIVIVSMLGLLLIVISCAHQIPVQKFSESRLHTPAEILHIMDKSKLVYMINIDSTLAPVWKISDENRLYPIYYQVRHDSGLIVLQYELSDQASEKINKAERFFQRQQYRDAIEYYREAITLAPKFYNIWTLIGDAFYNMGEYDSARVYLQKAIQLNFIDYDAHWYLADTYLATGKQDLALEQLTLAHVLNRTLPTLLDRLKSLREKSNPWNPWTFQPRYELSKSGHQVNVTATYKWLGYAMVKAVWKYEPGYAESMRPNHNNDDMLLSIQQEREALLAELTQEKLFPELTKAVNAGYADEAILYEVVLPQYPSAILSLDPRQIKRIAEYVSLAH